MLMLKEKTLPFIRAFFTETHIFTIILILLITVFAFASCKGYIDAKGTNLIKVTVTKKKWDIYIEAWYNNVKYATGTAVTDFKAGKTVQVFIPMKREILPEGNLPDDCFEIINTDGTAAAYRVVRGNTAPPSEVIIPAYRLYIRKFIKAVYSVRLNNSLLCNSTL